MVLTMLRHGIFSRFKQTESVLHDGEEVPGQWQRPDFLSRPLKVSEYQLYQVPSGMEGKPDLISDQFYGTTLLDWLLIVVNNDTSVLNWPRAGSIIKIPNQSLVSAELI